MEFSQLETFVTIAREKNFSRAAERMLRTQPAISIAIRRLEEEIGAPLFDRSRRSATLTDAGEALLAYAQRILNLRAEAIGSIKELRQLQRGKVSIGANESTSLYLLPQIILDYRQKYPGIKVEVYRSVSAALPREIIDMNLDFAILSFEPPDSDLESFPILNDDLVLIMSPKHPLAGRKSITIKELGKESFIAHNVKSPSRVKVIEAFNRFKVPLNIDIELSAIEPIKKFVQLGMGLAFVPRMCVQQELEQGTIATVPIEKFKIQRTLRIVYRRGKTHSYAAEAFLRVVKSFAQGSSKSI